MNEIAPAVAELLKTLLGGKPFLIAHGVTFEGGTVHVPTDHCVEECLFIAAGMSDGEVTVGV